MAKFAVQGAAQDVIVPMLGAKSAGELTGAKKAVCALSSGAP